MEREKGMIYFLKNLVQYLERKQDEKTFINKIIKKLEDEFKYSSGTSQTALVEFFGGMVILNPMGIHTIYSLKVPEKYREHFKDKTRDFKKALRKFVRGLKRADKRYWYFFYSRLDSTMNFFPHSLLFRECNDHANDEISRLFYAINRFSPLKSKLSLEILNGRIREVALRSVENLEGYIQARAGEFSKSFYIETPIDPDALEIVPKIESWKELSQI